VRNNPIGYIDSMGLAVGDSYPSVDDAGIAAASEFDGPSIATNREYAGVVYQNWDGTYSYTEPNIGTDRQSYPGEAPWLHDEVAIYHTHGAAEPNKDAENFSTPGPDGIGDTGLSDELNEPNYLGTPSYAIKKYDPCTKNTTTLRKGISL
jgi:hypothetical protein